MSKSWSPKTRKSNKINSDGVFTDHGYFEGISGILGKRLNLRKYFTDAALEVVPGGGIEPSTHGFSVRLAKTPIRCKYYIYQFVRNCTTLGFFGFHWVLLGSRGQSDGQSEKGIISNILLKFNQSSSLGAPNMGRPPREVRKA